MVSAKRAEKYPWRQRHALSMDATEGFVDNDSLPEFNACVQQTNC